MSLIWGYFALAIIVLLGLDLLTAPKYGDASKPRTNLKDSRRAA